MLNAATQIFQLQAFLPQEGSCLIDVSFYLAALKDRYAHAGGNSVSDFSASGRGPNEASLSVEFDSRKRFAFGGLHCKFSRTDARFRRQKFRANLVRMGQR